MTNILSKGKFIVFEGGEACGKTTQIKLLQKKFISNKNYIFTREPGGTDIANNIREILVTGDKDKISVKTEIALIYAARNDHLEKVILPNLKKGKTVICDRFHLSTFVYQAIARGLNTDFIQKIDELFLEGFKPDLTFIFDLDIQVSRKRIKKEII